MEKKSALFSFDNHISIGHIVMTGSIIVTVIFWYANTENRLTALEGKYNEVITLIERNNRELNEKMGYQRLETKDDLRDIKDSLKSIENKIDRKQDKKQGN